MDKILLISHKKVVGAASGRMIQAQRDRRKTGNGTKENIEMALEFCIFTVCTEILALPRGSREGKGQIYMRAGYGLRTAKALMSI